MTIEEKLKKRKELVDKNRSSIEVKIKKEPKRSKMVKEIYYKWSNK